MSVTINREAGDQDFYAVCEEIMNLHERKSRDYGNSKDPLANITACSEFGIEP